MKETIKFSGFSYYKWMDAVLHLQDILDPWGFKRLRKLLQTKGNIKQPITVLTGGELSKASGLSAFRGEGGIWHGHRVESVSFIDSLQKNPSLALRFYNHRRKELVGEKYQPNAAHLALTKLANVVGEVFLTTHNTDNLQERAGSSGVIHLYGNFLQNKCDKCFHKWESHEDLHRELHCPGCQAKAVRPDVVFIKEKTYRMETALECMAQSRVFISIGSQDSELVESFLIQARSQGALCIELNPKPNKLSEKFDLVIKKPLSESVPLIVDFLIYQP